MSKKLFTKFFVFLLVVGLLFAATQTVQAQGPTTRTVCAEGCDFTTIQAAIDGAAAGDTILVYPGAYDETASGRTLDSGGTYQFGLFFDSAKPGITVQGVKADGSVITAAADVAASIKTNATNSFGYSGVFVEADNITITGLEFLDNYVAGAVDNNKTLEVIGNNFTFKDNVMSVAGGGSLYLNDWSYDSGTGISRFESYNISENLFKFGASVDISSGVGVSGLASGRVIADNTFTADGEDVYWANISFNGTIPSIGWFVYPVGGATITGNTFIGGEMPIRSRGIVEDDFDWASYITGNNFEKAVIAWDTVNNKPRSYTYACGSYTCENTILIGTVIQDEIGHAQPGDEVRVIKGTFIEDITIDKDITLVGIPDPFAVSPVVVVDGLVTLTADGASVSNLKIAPGNVSGQVAAVSIYASNTTVSGNLIDGMVGDNTASIKGIFAYGGSATALENITVSGNTIKNISNPGTLVKGTDGIQIQGNLIGVDVTNNIIQNISSQGWAFGIEVTPSGANPTLPPQDVVITGNTISNISAVTYPGIALSVDAYNAANPANASEVTVNLNRFNLLPVVNKDGVHSLNAENNWWGTAIGPQPSMMFGTMDASPWCTNPECTLFAPDPLPIKIYLPLIYR